MKKTVKIDRKIKMLDLVDLYPKAAEVLMAHGFHCLGCALAHFETLEDGAKAHGLSDQEIDQLIEKIKSASGKKTDKAID